MKNTVKFEFLSLSENEALARSVAAAFIMPLDPTLEELADVRTAVSEAVTNAIVHGYKKKKGTVRMECRLDGRLLVISITDFGCGIENIEQALERMEQAIRKKIRSVDACTRYSSMQYLIILFEPIETEIPHIMDRIFMQYRQQCDNTDFRPTYEYLAIAGEKQ